MGNPNPPARSRHRQPRAAARAGQHAAPRFGARAARRATASSPAASGGARRSPRGA